MRSTERHVQRAVENAVAAGETTCDDPRKIARYLNMTAQGLNVLARSGSSKKTLRERAELALKALG